MQLFKIFICFSCLGVEASSSPKDRLMASLNWQSSYLSVFYNSPLSKRVETWGEDWRPFIYGIVWVKGVGTHKLFVLNFVCPQTIPQLSASLHSSQVSTLLVSGLCFFNHTVRKITIWQTLLRIIISLQERFNNCLTRLTNIKIKAL